MMGVAAVLALCLLPASARAQAAAAALPALPKPLTSAKTLFIGMGGTALPGRSQTAAALLYTSTLQALNNGPYSLTQDPAGADLIGIVSIAAEGSDVTNGNSFNYTYVRFTLLDPRTHTPLWVLNEDLQGAFRKASFEKNLDVTTKKLATDVNSLAAGKMP